MNVEKLIERAKRKQVITVDFDMIERRATTEDRLVNPDGPALAEALSRQKAAGDAIAEATNALLAQFDAYQNSDLNYECAHRFLVRYELWERLGAALTAWNSIEQGDE